MASTVYETEICDGDVTTDKKLGLERFQVGPALICQMYRAEITLHVKRVMLRHVIAIFNQSLYHRLSRKNGYIFRLPTLNTHTTCRAKHRFY